jgi:AP-1-like factor
MAGPLASNRAPGAHLPNGNKGSSNRNNTNGSVQSRSSSMNQAKGLYNVASEIADLSHLFSPSILASVSPTGSGDYMSFNKNVAQPSPPVLQTNSQGNGGASDTTSPSSLQTLDSSCGTTPEPSIDSPGQRKISGAGDNSWQVSDQQEQFCEQFAQACGNKDDPIPPTLKQSNIPAATATLTKTPALEFPGFDWMAAQNGGNFNPVLFGDYRDPQENIMSADFGDFFNEAFPMPDIGSPLNVPLEPALPKKVDLMKQIEENANGAEPEVVPADGPKQFLTCNMLW